jgi:hypothetical protein
MPLTHRLIPLVLMAFAACSGETDRGPSATRLRLAETPLVSIPDAAPDGRYTMGTMQGAHRMGDGSIAVWAGPDLYLFDSTGQFLRRAGGRGEGPGEFRAISGAGECTAGQLTLWDAAERRLTRIGGAERDPVVQDERGLDMFTSVVGCDDGALVMLARPLDLTTVGPVQEQAHLIRVSPTSAAAETLATIPGLLHAGPLQRLAAFPVAGAREGMILLADNGSGRIVRWHDGIADTIIARLPRRAATAEAADSIKQWWLEHSGLNGAAAPPGIREMIEQIWPKLPLPDSLPLFSGMMLDDDGTIWLSEYVGYEMGFHLRPTRWTAVNDEGNPTRVLELPPDFDLMQLTGGAVLGIQENEDGSLAVQVRAIERS